MYAMSCAFIISVLSFLVAFFVLALATAHWRRTRVNIGFLLFSLAVTGWMFLEIVYRLSPHPEAARLLIRIEPLFWLVTGALILEVGYGLTQRATDTLLWVVRGVAVISVALSFATPWVYAGFNYGSMGLTEQKGPLFAPLATLNIAMPAAVTVWLLMAERRKSRDPVKRRYLGILLLSLGMATTIGFIGDVILPMVIRIDGQPEFVPAAIALLSVGLVMATTRYHFLRPGTTDLLADFFRHSPDGVALLDADHRLLRINQPARELLDLPKGETLSESQLELIVGPQGEATNQHDRYRVRFPSGSRVLAVHRAELDHAGRERTLLVFLRDVTDQVSLEERDQKARHLETVSTLAGGTAHHLNNILSVSMLVSSTLLEELQPNDPLYPEMRSVLRAAERGQTIIEDLLAYTQRGVAHVATPYPLDLNGLLQFDVSRNQLGNLPIPSAVTVLLDLAQNLPRVTADEKQLQRVLRHLCRNSLEAMEDTGTLTIQTAAVLWSADDPERPPELAPGRYVQLRFADTGTGMDEQTRARACEPFYTTKGMVTATGLGLAVVYGTVAALNGNMTLESAPEAGTVITLQLPVAASLVTKSASAA